MATVIRQSVPAPSPDLSHVDLARLDFIKVLVADDHPVVRFGVRNMLESDASLSVVGEAIDGEDALAKTIQLQPDILLLDLHMPRLNGLDTLRAILSRAPGVKVLLLSSTISHQQVIEALQLGAWGVVLKTSIAEDITHSIDAVLRGSYWVSGRSFPNLRVALQYVGQQAVLSAPQRSTFGLTPRELEVVSGIVEGCSNKDIALKFTISEETVKRHLSNIFDKTGVSTRLELALFAINHKLIEPRL
jgi:DNA-binding NarL/FixJ family response regulator